MALSRTRSNSYVWLLFPLSIVALLCATVAVGQEAADATPVASKTAEPPPTEPAENPAAETEPAEEKPAAAESEVKEPAPDDAPAPEDAPAVGSAPPADNGPPLDFSKLAEPAIAERLQLSDEQRARVAALLTERTTAADAAKQAEKAKVLEESDQKLAGVLNEQQLADFKKPEPRLRFQFRFERWEDVLNWFAQQADLSLVLDAPPPGTFNYSDTKEYTPTEAIDLLNGVLLTKGYTLVRRGRMLVVVNLKDGIPEGVVPKVTLEELEKRGKFELVTVAFPLGRRPAATVSSEIAPLLSPNGKAVPMPATAQILVTDTAGIMRAIGAVIESIAEEPVVPTPPEPESLVTAVYPVKPADPKAVVEVLGAMVSSAKIVLDEEAGQIHVYATPSQQSLVKEILQQMQAGHAPEKRPRLETYPVAEAGAEGLLQTLETIVPDARLTLDQNTGKLVAWAASDDQETIKETIEKLSGEQSPARIPQFEVYRLTKADPDMALNLLQNILPEAKLAVDAQSRMLIAVAVPADQDVIRRTLAQLQPETPSPNIPELRYYPLALNLTPDSITALKKTVPRATIVLEANGDRLMVVATSEEHEQVKATIGQIEGAAFAKLRSKLVIYPVTLAQRKRFMAVLSNLQNRLPGMRVIEDAEPGELSVWAKPPQHEVLAEILVELRRDVPSPEKYDLVAYPITTAEGANVLSVLTEMFPDTKLVLDEPSERLLAWTRSDEHDLIKKAIEQLQPQPDAEDAPVLRVYPYPYPATPGAPPSVDAALQQLVPKAQFTVDTVNQQLIVVASPADQAIVKKTLDEIDVGLPAEKQPRFEVYRVRGGNADELLTTLATLVPEARLTADPKTGNLIVWATPEEQQQVKTALGTLQRGGAGSALEETPQLEVYRLTKADPSTTLSLLQELLPDAKLSVDAQTNSLIALAIPQEQRAIRAMLDQLQSQPPDPNAPELQFYPLSRPPPQSLLTVLQNAAPQAQVTLEPGGKHLTVLASPSDHQIIKKIVERIEETAPLEEKNKLVIYPVTPTQRKRFEAVRSELTAELPGIKVVAEDERGELAIWAKPTQHAVIAQIMEELEGGAADDEKYQLVVYPVTPTQRKRFEVVMESMAEELPGLKVIADAEPGELAIWGKPTQHLAIAQIMEGLQSDAAAGEEYQLMVYQVTPAQRKRFEAVMESMTDELPGLKVIADAEPGELAIWARPSQQITVGQLIDQLKRDVPAEEKYQLVAYQIRSADPASVLNVLQNLFPDTQIVLDAKARRLAIWTRPEQHQAIRAAIEQLDSDELPATQDKVMVYPIRDADPTVAISILQEMLPDVTFQSDTTAGTIIATGRERDQQRVKQLLEQLQVGNSPENRPRLEVYPYPYPAQQTSPPSLKSPVTAGVKLPEPSSLISALQQLAPDAQFTLDTKGKRLLVVATPEDHQVIKAALDQVAQSMTFEEGEQLVVYSVKSADPASVLKLLESLFPDARTVLDEKTGRLAVWTGPKQHLAIRAAIEQLDSRGSGGGKEEVAVYPLRESDPEVAIGILQELLPEAKFQSDTTAGTIIATAGEEDHQRIQQVIEQLQVKSSPENRPRLEVYPVGVSDAAGLVATLQPMVPEAQLSVDPTGSKLVAWGTPQDQETLKTAIEKMGQGGPLDGARQVEVYRLTKADPDTTLALLQTLVPGAKLSTDPQTRSLVALATTAEHRTIRGTLQQLQPAVPDPDAPQLHFYPLMLTAPPDLVTGLQELAPEAQITLGGDGRRVMVVARAEDHNVIKTALDKVEETAALQERNQLVIYAVTPAQRKRFQAVIETLTEELPGIKMIADAQPGELSIWAKPTQHIVLTRIIDQFKRDVPEAQKYRLVAYPIRSADPQSVLSVMEELFPEAKLVLDKRTRRLMAWTRPEDHQAIKSALEQMDSGTPGEGREKFMAHPIPDADPAVAIEMLQHLMPEVRFSSDATAGTIVAFARESEHQTIAKAIEQMQAGPDAQHQPTIVEYPAGDGDPESMQTMLGALVPNAQVVADVSKHSLIVLAKPKDHQTIATAVEQMAAEAPQGEKATIGIYSLQTTSRSGAYYTYRLLRNAVPGATFTLGDEQGQLIAWARPKDHQLIEALIEQISQKPSPEKAPRLVVYTLKEKTAADAEAVLQEIVPNADLTVDGSNPNKLNAWAAPPDHEMIESVLKQIDVADPPESVASVKVYTLQTSGRYGGYYTMRLLRDAVPGATFTVGSDPNQLIAWARPKDHELIQAMLDQVSAKLPPEKAPKLVVYTLKEKMADDAENVLEDIVPDAELTVDSTNPQKLNAWATPSDHAMIEKVLEQLDAADPPESVAKVVVYSLETNSETRSYYALRFLRDAVPGANLTLGTEPGQVIAWARPVEHKKLKELVDQLSKEVPPEKAPKLVVYTLQSKAAADVTGILEEAVPDAKLTMDADPQKLNVWARAADHAIIAEVLEQLDVEEPPETAPKVVVYALESIDAATAMALMQTAFPDAQFSAGSVSQGGDPHKLIAFARPAEHAKIQSAVDQLSQKEPPETAPRAEVYTLESGSRTQSVYTIRLLREAVPGATFTLGDDDNQLVVWARPKDHEMIKQLVDQLAQEAPAEKRPKLVVYTLTEKTADHAMEVLQTAVPEAQFAADADPQKLNVWARSKDHQTIEEIVAQIDVAEPAETAHVVEVYTLKSTTAAEALEFLTTAFASAHFTAGSDPRQLIVWARPAEHEKIKAAVEQMSTEETAAKVVTYTLETAGAARAVEILAPAVPTAQLTVGPDPSQLIVYARPADHEVIAAAVEQLEAGGLADSKRVLAVYPMRKEDVPSMLEVLDEGLKANARFVTDPHRDSLVVWADPKIQAAVRSAVDQFLQALPEAIEPSSHVYRFRNADPAAALSVLTALVPEAEIALDTTNRSLVVSALPEDHEKIRETIAEMDREDAEWAPKLQIHRVASADLPNLLSVLQLLFVDRPEVQLSVDEPNNAVIAVAAPADHQKIRELIADVEAASAGSTLELYSLKNVDSYSVLTVLDKVLRKQAAKVDLSIDISTNQLIAVAPPEEHELIRSTLQQFRTEERQLEIFQLDFVEPSTAQLAISHLFRDEGIINTPDASSDAETQQLFVRATQQQLEEIRALLIKLGETGLTSVTGAGSDRLRVIPFHGDTRAALSEIQRIWPQLRDNPIRVVTPSAVTPLLRPSGEPAPQPKKSPPEKPASGPSSSTDAKAEPETETPAGTGAKGDDGPPGEQGAEGDAEAPAGDPEDSAQGVPVPPVMVVLGDGSITIASEDLAALDQFESLLRTLMQRTGYSGRDFSIFPVENTSAASIAATLTQLFRTSRTGTARSYGSSRETTNRIAIIPDERLNTILVKGSRADRAKIEDLLKILDTAEDSRTLRIIPLKKTNATRVQQALEMILKDNASLRRSTRN